MLYCTTDNIDLAVPQEPRGPTITQLFLVFLGTHQLSATTIILL